MVYLIHFEEKLHLTLYAACSYWQHTAVAKRLVKGAVVEVEGTMYIRVFAGKDGELKSAANFRCRRVKVFGETEKEEASSGTEEGKETAVNKIEHMAAITEPRDSLPL